MVILEKAALGRFSFLIAILMDYFKKIIDLTPGRRFGFCFIVWFNGIKSIEINILTKKLNGKMTIFLN
jgi:hypothetical protein